MTGSSPPVTVVDLAKEVSRNAYCPYSKFHVGAVIVSTRGNIYKGCNFENAAYGSTICAERNAVGSMIAAGDQGIELIVIYTPTLEPAPPCGACRQVLNEFSPEATVMSYCDSDLVLVHTVKELLPGAFGPKNLT